MPKDPSSHVLGHFTMMQLILSLTCSGVPGEPLPVESEEDIFGIIEYPYKKPGERNM